MATVSETDLSASQPWNRASFSNTFKRKPRKNKGSETSSIAGSGGLWQERRASLSEEAPRPRRDSVDSARNLPGLLSSIKRRGKKSNAESESSESLSRTATEASLPLDDSGNYTEDDEEP
jgi:hypothetical protein